MKKLLALLLTAVVVTALARDFPKNSPDFKTLGSNALNAAEKEGKPVILVFSAPWCPPCQAMKNDVYPSDAVKPFHDKFVWAYLDVDESRNEKLGAKYGVQGIPHIQFLDSKGNPIDKQVGSTTPEAFAKTLEGILAKSAKSS
jgi:thioredoxin-related protein